MWKDKLKLEADHVLQHARSFTKGFMEEEDVEEYRVVDSAGQVVGTVVHTDHTAVKGFKRTLTVRQLDAQGRVLVEERWTV